MWGQVWSAAHRAGAAAAGRSWLCPGYWQACGRSPYSSKSKKGKAVFELRLLLKSHGPPAPKPPTTFNQSVSVRGVVSVRERMGHGESHMTWMASETEITWTCLHNHGKSLGMISPNHPARKNDQLDSKTRKLRDMEYSYKSRTRLSTRLVPIGCDSSCSLFALVTPCSSQLPLTGHTKPLSVRESGTGDARDWEPRNIPPTRDRGRNWAWATGNSAEEFWRPRASLRSPLALCTAL